LYCFEFINSVGAAGMSPALSLGAEYVPTEVGDRLSNVVSLIKGRTMDNVQNCDSYINIPKTKKQTNSVG
jgi:hypothetical protein